MNAETLIRIFADSALNINFVVEIEGIVSAGFKKVTGIEESVEFRRVVENNSPIPIEIPESVQFPDIELHQGLATNDSLFQWYKKCRDWKKGDEDYRKDLSIVQIRWVNNLPLEIDRWDIFGAYVKSYQAPEYDSENQGLSIVKIRLGRESTLYKPYSIGNKVSSLINVVKRLI